MLIRAVDEAAAIAAKRKTVSLPTAGDTNQASTYIFGKAAVVAPGNGILIRFEIPVGYFFELHEIRTQSDTEFPHCRVTLVTGSKSDYRLNAPGVRASQLQTVVNGTTPNKYNEFGLQPVSVTKLEQYAVFGDNLLFTVSHDNASQTVNFYLALAGQLIPKTFNKVD